jgi:hypothetical protein
VFKCSIGVLKEVFYVNILHRTQNTKEIVSKRKDLKRITYRRLMSSFDFM